MNMFSSFLGEDTTMRFSLTPVPGEKGFQQWKDAISVATRMPGGIPASIRQKVGEREFLIECNRINSLLALDLIIHELHPRDSFRLGENLSICI